MTEKERQLLEQCSKDLVEIKESLRNLSNVVSKTVKTEISEQITSTLEQYTRILPKISNSYMNDNEELDAIISKTLQEIGIPCNFNGYHYLKTAIALCIEDLNMLNGITKKLYPLVAEIHETTPSSVENGITNAIVRTFTHGNIEYLNSIFSYTLSSNKEKATNKEFISTLAYKIKFN